MFNTANSPTMLVATTDPARSLALSTAFGRRYRLSVATSHAAALVMARSKEPVLAVLDGELTANAAALLKEAPFRNCRVLLLEASKPPQRWEKVEGPEFVVQVPAKTPNHDIVRLLERMAVVRVYPKNAARQGSAYKTEVTSPVEKAPAPSMM